MRVLVSDDGGQTFRFLAFNAPGAVDAVAFPNVTPGRIYDCTSGRFRNALVAGVDQGGGRFGFPRFRQATRIFTQSHAAAARGTFLFVLNSSTSPFFGDPAAGSEIDLVFSPDGGQSWAPTFRVVASTADDPQHVHPAVSLSRDAKKLTISYYVQQADSRLRTDLATLEIADRRVRLKKTAPLSSTAFDLTPSNVVFTPTETTNFDRTASPCYDIGEYQTLARSLRDDDDGVIAAWGDNRRSWVSPPDSSAAGTHSKPDVFLARVGDDLGFYVRPACLAPLGHIFSDRESECMGFDPLFFIPPSPRLDRVAPETSSLQTPSTSGESTPNPAPSDQFLIRSAYSHLSI